jgi:site-specific recombinase XerD
MNDLILAEGPAADTGGAVSSELQLWPGVDDPACLLAGIADWLTGYGNHQTRRTYAEGLGLPVTATDIQQWTRIRSGDEPWAEALSAYAHALSIDASSPTRTQHAAPRRAAPPPAARGRLRHLHWFRWCASDLLDPARATSAHVKTWLDALAGAGAAPATRDRMLATVKTLYAYLADVGLVEANPAALNRRRLGLATATTSTSSTITLTSRQVRALHAAAASARRGASPLDTARAVAVVALFTLGLRVSELCGLDRADLHVTRGRRALRVRGKGGKVRIVYLSVPAETALTDYLKSAQAAVPQPAADVVHGLGPPIPQQEPLLCTRNGRRFQRQAIWQLLRRVAARGSHDLQAIADAIHPHALRHFYVTTAVEAGAQLAHIQADVGHSSIDTTQQTYDHAARDPARSAVDLVADSWHQQESEENRSRDGSGDGHA